MNATLTPTVVSPYRGLTPFEDSDLDAVLFFGREREREVIAANLLASRLTVLYGASGVGKSSILRAGVAHHLRGLARRNLASRGHPEFAVVVFDAWTGDPMQGLLDAAYAELVDLFGADAPHERASNPTDTLHDWSDRLACDLLLVLDGTEEYFLYHELEDGQGTFAGELPELVTRPGLRVSALLAIRDDALARLDRFKGRIPKLFANYLRLDHLDPRAARAAIVGPIDEYNRLFDAEFAIEPKLVDALLDETATGRVDLGQRGRGVVRAGGTRSRIEAPYLQLVLQRLWDEEQAEGSSVLRIDTLRRLGGAGEIVRTHLERALAELGPGERDVAATVFGHLVTPSGTKIAHGVQDLAEYAHVGTERVEPIVSRLVHQRILRPVAKSATNGHVNGSPYEIFHDVLGDAILAWRTRHESERRVERERAAANRRHRRVLGVLAIAFALLAAMTAVAAYAIAQRSEARRLADVASVRAEEATAERKKAVKATKKAVAAQKRTERALEKARREESRARDAEGRAQSSASVAIAQTEIAKDQTRLATARGIEADQQADRATSEAQRATSETARANLESDRAKASERRAEEGELAARRSAQAATRSARRAEARELTQRALVALTQDPARTIELALQAARLEPSTAVEDVLRQGLLELRVRAVLAGGGPLRGAIFSADGALIATASESGNARIFRADPPTLLRTLGHGSALTAVAFSPNADLVATAASDGTVVVWDTATGFQRHTLRHDGPVTSVAFSPDGRVVATASSDRTARIWDVATGIALASFSHPNSLRAATFSPDGHLLATVPVIRDRFARVFDVSTDRRVVDLEHGGVATSARFSPDGATLVTSGRRNLFVWDRATWARRHLIAGSLNAIRGLAFSPDSARVLAYDDIGLGRVFRLDTGALVTMLIRHENEITDGMFHPGGAATVLTASADLTARLWTGNISEFRTSLVGHREEVVSAEFNPTGTRVLTASADATARIWTTETEPTLAEIARHNGGATAMALSADGQRVFSGGADGVVRITRARGGPIDSIEAHRGRVSAVALSSDGRTLLTAGEDGIARVWEVATRRKLAEVSHGAPVRQAKLSADGRRFVTVGGNTARIWTRDGSDVATVRHDDAVTSVALSRDGRFVVTGSADRTARMWSMADGSELGVLRGHTDSVVAVAVSPDGSWVATASTDLTARLHPANGGKAHELRGHREPLTSVMFSEDGRQLLTADVDGSVQSWIVANGRRIVVFRGHVATVVEARFSPNRRWIVTAGPSAAGVFDAVTGTRLYFLRGHSAPLTAAAFVRDSRRVVTAGTDGTVRTYFCQLCGDLDELRRIARNRLRAIEQVPARPAP